MFRLITIIFIATLVTACGVSPISSTPTPFISTKTPIPSSSTPTIFPTVTSTSTPTIEPFVPIEISMNHEKPVEITLEDLTSGRLADSERETCPPFPKKVIAPNWEQDLMVNTQNIPTVEHIQVVDNTLLNGPAPEARGEKICSFSQLTMDWGRGVGIYILIGIQVRNQNGTDGFFHVLRRPEQVADFVEQIKEYSVGIVIESLKESPAYPEWHNVPNMYPDMEALGAQLVATGVLPKEFERRPIISTGNRWYQG